jgi:hypothetical protein
MGRMSPFATSWSFVLPKEQKRFATWSFFMSGLQGKQMVSEDEDQLIFRTWPAQATVASAED